ncbi:MAG: magnesium/cobalt transporter CorA [Pseudomonadota bacterium]
MLTMYSYENNKIMLCETSNIQKSLSNALWIDLNSPTLEEEKQVEDFLGIDIPTRDEIESLELSRRLYKERGNFYLTATILTHADTREPENKTYTFVLTDKRLVTVRYADTQPFSTTSERLQKQEILREADPKLIAISLFEALTNRLSDILEQNGNRVDALSKSIFHAKKNIASRRASDNKNLSLEEAICETGIEGDILSKIKESLVSMNRLIAFVKQSGFLEKNSEEDHRMEIIAVDISSLNEHAAFLANKVTFLLDATLGLIGIEQNAIIKIFSVAAVIFLPPTLVASIYGMNFTHMPELHWVYGYPASICMIILAAYVPYKFFKHKNWL